MTTVVTKIKNAKAEANINATQRDRVSTGGEDY